MAILIPNEGELRWINEMLDGGLTRENHTFKLYKTNVTPAATDTSAAYTVCDFTNYVDKTLTRTVGVSTWQTPASGSPTGSWNGGASVAESTYGSSAQSWTCGTTGNTVYGYYVLGATSAKVMWAELFATARTLANGDTLSITPRLGFASGS